MSGSADVACRGCQPVRVVVGVPERSQQASRTATGVCDRRRIAERRTGSRARTRRSAVRPPKRVDAGGVRCSLRRLLHVLECGLQAASGLCCDLGQLGAAGNGDHDRDRSRSCTRHAAPGPMAHRGPARAKRQPCQRTRRSPPAARPSGTVAWALSSVHHWSDRAAGLAEAGRVLAPAGRILLAEFLKPPALPAPAPESGRPGTGPSSSLYWDASRGPGPDRPPPVNHQRTTLWITSTLPSRTPS